jgi:SAM-dependent methyltransferase
MVHALEEIHRVLIPLGILLDLRPLADRWPVEIVAGDLMLETGRLTDLPLGLSDDQAANLAADTAARMGLYSREKEIVFFLNIYWDDPDEMNRYVSEKWVDYLSMNDEIQKTTRETWERSGTDRKVRIRLKMLLTRWNKQV